MRFQLGKLNVPAVQPEAGIQLYVYKTNQHGFRVLIIEQSTSAQNWINILAKCNHDEQNKVWNQKYEDWKFEEKLSFHLVLLGLLVK